MFIPVGDTPNPRRTPYVNYLLIGVNVAVFLFVTLPLTMQPPDLSDPALMDYLYAIGIRGPVPAQAILDQLSAYDLIMFEWGFRPAEASLVTLTTAMFLHGGWMHLAGNMLFLWIFGDNVENRLGSIGYLFAYLACGAAATLFFALFVSQSQTPLVGASGAISGVLGFYFLWFKRNRVKVFIFLFPFIMTTVMVPARIVLGIYLILDNLLPFLLAAGAAASGVAHGAHIGGFLAGAGLGWGLDRMPRLTLWKKEQKAEAEVADSASDDHLLAPAARIHHFLRHGEPDRARRLFLGLEHRRQRDPVASEDILAIGEHLLEQHHFSLALPLFRRFISERPRDPLLGRAYLGAGRSLVHNPRYVTTAYQYFLQAVDVARQPDVVEEARAHLRAIERWGEQG